MKKIVLGFALIAFHHLSNAQQQIATIPIKSYLGLKDHVACIVGDSVILGFGKPLPALRLILPDGTVKALPFQNLFEDRKLLGVSAAGDDLYFYYLNRLKEITTIHAVKWNRTTNQYSENESPVKFTEPIAALYMDNDLHVVTANKTTSLLTISRIHKLDVVKANHIPLPPKFFEGTRIVAVIREGVELNPWQAEASFKIYLGENKLRISMSRDLLGAFVLNADLSVDPAKVELQEFPEKFEGFVSSLLYRDYVFIATHAKDTDMNIHAYDLNGKKLSTTTLGLKTPFADSAAFLRATDSKRILKNRTVWHAVDAVGRPFVAAFPYDDTRIILKVGTHRELNPDKTLNPPNPLGLLSSKATYIAKVQPYTLQQETFSSDMYFYLIGNPTDGFTYWNGDGVIGRKIDALEQFTLDKRVDYFIKGYAIAKNFIIGYYREEKENDVIKVIKYTREK